jgi:hypothetical protein
VSDTHAIGASALRLASGSRRNGKVGLAVLSAVLGEGEQVEQVLVGKLHGVDGACALVGGEVVLVNGRVWDPEVMRLPVAGLQVQGVQDGRSATLTFVGGAAQEVFDRIADSALAVEFANRVRQRAAGG